MGRGRLRLFSSTSAVCEYQPLGQTYELEDLDDTETDIDTMAGLDKDAAIIVTLGEADKEQFGNEKKLQVGAQHSDDSVPEDIESDGIHDGLVFPTDEERATLRRVSDHIPRSAYRQ